MSSLSYKPAALLCPLALCISSFSQANPIPNDLLRYEQWGLNNTPRAIETSPSNIPEESISETGTCAEKPDIIENSYTCNSYTSSGVEDMDINAAEGWAAYVPSDNLNQQEVVIALIDTGIDYTHPDLADKVWLNPGETTGIDANSNGIDDGCEDTIDGDNNGYLNDCHGINALVDRENSDGSLNPLAGDPLDDEVGHGTNMSGVLGAIANNTDENYHGGIVGVTGFEPRIKIAACKSAKMESDVFPLIPGVAVPAGKESALVDCLWYFYNLKQSGVNIAVINASGGMSKHINMGGIMYPLVADPYLLNTPNMYMLADLLQAEDISVIAAAGNNSWSIDQVVEERAYYPASFENTNIIAVGATNNQGNLWAGTSYGRFSVDVMAPGQDILSTNPSFPIFSEENSDFIVSHGSSQATAYVTGMVALLKANASTEHLDSTSIRRLLLSSSKPIPAATNKSVSGGLARLADNNGKGVLTCDNQVFRRRQLPKADAMVALPNSNIKLAVESYNCANPGSETEITVTVQPTGETFMLYDNGLGDDELAGDGIFSGNWTVPFGHFQYTLSSGYDSVLNGNDELIIKASIIEDNVDNTDWVGKWWPSFYRYGYYGTNYRYATTNDPEKIFTWSPTLNEAGYYEVFARWPQGPNFATNATFRVHHQSSTDGSNIVTEVQQDQTTNGNQWISIGTYWFEAGTRDVQLTNLNANGTVVADAIQFAPVL